MGAGADRSGTGPGRAERGGRKSPRGGPEQPPLHPAGGEGGGEQRRGGARRPQTWEQATRRRVGAVKRRGEDGNTADRDGDRTGWGERDGTEKGPAVGGASEED